MLTRGSHTLAPSPPSDSSFDPFVHRPILGLGPIIVILFLLVLPPPPLPFSPESHASHIPLRPYTYSRATCFVDHLAPEIVPSSRFPSQVVDCRSPTWV